MLGRDNGRLGGIDAGSFPAAGYGKPLAVFRLQTLKPES
jgi:hypothetical protein